MLAAVHVGAPPHQNSGRQSSLPTTPLTGGVRGGVGTGKGGGVLLPNRARAGTFGTCLEDLGSYQEASGDSWKPSRRSLDA